MSSVDCLSLRLPPRVRLAEGTTRLEILAGIKGKRTSEGKFAVIPSTATSHLTFPTFKEGEGTPLRLGSSDCE